MLSIFLEDPQFRADQGPPEQSALWGLELRFWVVGPSSVVVPRGRSKPSCSLRADAGHVAGVPHPHPGN